jgi:uncharacterized membrane protein (DUF441 family)
MAEIPSKLIKLWLLTFQIYISLEFPLINSNGLKIGITIDNIPIIHASGKYVTYIGVLVIETLDFN